MYRKYIKRLLDIILSLIAIIILLPIYAIISILVLIFMGWPILFKQPRPGKNEKIFNMYKFRTMTNRKDKEGNLLPDEQRLNKFGKLLRATSLDELPELFCILTGKMSIVGPRPLVVEYLPYYNEREKHRFDVLPGLTGLAQVNGGNALQWEEQFEYDLEYVKNISFKEDIRILYKSMISNFIKKKAINDIKDFKEYRTIQNNQRMIRKNEIGSNFFEYTLKNSNKNYFHPLKKYYKELFFISGRNATYALVKSLKIENKVVLLPSYTCGTVIEPFIRDNWQIIYYTINKNLEVNEQDIITKIKLYHPSMILVHSFFGINTLKNIRSRLEEIKDVLIVEDITQSILSDFKKIKADYYITSLRKFFAITDGGMLIIPYKKNNIEIKYENIPNKIVKHALKGFDLKRSYIENITNIEKEKFQEEYLEVKKLISSTYNIEKISKEGLKMFNNLDISKIKGIRKQNFNYLLENFKSKDDNVELIFKTLRIDETPLYFPIYIKNGNREKMQKHLASKNIFCPIIWPKSEYIKETSEETEYIYNNILCIPCDQRYNLQDMQKIIDEINSFKST